MKTRKLFPILVLFGYLCLLLFVALAPVPEIPGTVLTMAQTKGEGGNCRLWKQDIGWESWRNVDCQTKSQFSYWHDYNIAFKDGVPQPLDYTFVRAISTAVNCSNPADPYTREETGCRIFPQVYRFWSVFLCEGNTPCVTSWLYTEMVTGCDSNCSSPILIPLKPSGSGIENSMSNATSGVWFDIPGQGTKEQHSWPVVGEAAWLALDRNGNGVIDNGTELFGNFTPQPAPTSGARKNGFLALAEYDKAEQGGNGDGKISNKDSAYTVLRLWKDDSPRDGITDAGELLPLAEAGIISISLSYHDAAAQDRWGNSFAYRANATTTKGVVQARDVYVMTVVR
jgi:hypothetical protein